MFFSEGDDFVHASGTESAEVYGDVVIAELAEYGIDFSHCFRLADFGKVGGGYFDAGEVVVVSYPAFAEAQGS